MSGDSNDAVRLTGPPAPGGAGLHGQSGRPFDAQGDTATGADVPPTAEFSVRRSTTRRLLRVAGPLTGQTAPLLAAALDPLTRLGASVRRPRRPHRGHRHDGRRSYPTAAGRAPTPPRWWPSRVGPAQPDRADAAVQHQARPLLPHRPAGLARMLVSPPSRGGAHVACGFRPRQSTCIDRIVITVHALEPESASGPPPGSLLAVGVARHGGSRTSTRSNPHPLRRSVHPHGG